MHDLGRSVRKGLVWSFANTIILRLGSLIVGIVLARLLTPEVFGIYAVALAVQSILMTLADLGLSADLVRSGDPERREPTVATLSLGSGVLLTALMASLASPLADAMGTPQAAPVIVVLSGTLILSSAGVVPYARLQRRFGQRELFASGAVDFVVSTGVTLALVLAGMGPMALAVARLVAQASATAVQFVLSRTRPHFGFDRSIAGPALRFGLPLAGANLLSWALLNVDNIVIARAAGEVALGFYVLAFNVSSWPMTAIGTAIRSVSLAASSRTTQDREVAGDRSQDPNLAIATAFAWAAALPAGALLAVLAVPIIGLLYGDRWQAAAPILAALGIFGALRVVFDLMATYLMARGAARPVLWIQILWIVALIPAMILAIDFFGLAGVGWAHVVVAVLVILPAYFWALHGVRAAAAPVLAVLWPPMLAAAAAWISADYVSSRVASPLPALLLGGASGLLVYAALIYKWLRGFTRRVERLSHASSATGRDAAHPVPIDDTLRNHR